MHIYKIMEDSHFNSQYFWSPVPVQGQIENAMFLKQLKDQEKNTSFPSSHYQTTMLTVPKQEGGGQGQGGHQHPPHTQNITVVPVASTGIMTAGLVITTPQGTQLVSPASSSQSFVAGHPTMIVSTLHTPDKKQEGGTPQVIVMPTPLKRGRKKKSTLGRGVLSGGHTLSAGNEALILAHLASGGQVVMSSQHYTTDPYDLANEDENHGGKDCNKTYRCRMCAVTFFSKSDMQIHSKSHTEAKPHKCPHCSKSFANSSYLAQHIRIHSGAKPYTCSYCQKSFRQLSHLQQHTRNHTESKPHKCPHCTKSFANSSYLAQHIRIHTGVKPYTCSFCQKSFRQLSHLQQHNRIHTGDRPYKCVHTGCEKSFTQLSNLQSHRRQHNKDKPFKCTNCNRGYTDAASLEVHLSTHTVKHAKLYSCGLCNRTYTSETYLVKHMQKHNSNPLTAAAVAAAQHSQQNQQNQSHTQNQGGSHGQGRGEGTDSGAVRAGGQGGDHGQGQNQGSYSQAETASCPFDLHQYKTVAAGDIQFKSVSVADLATHKDLCLTVATSTIQVEHLNS
ncbi:zinc finger protein 384-like isoform X3 [Oncorhynchus kisutch]|uniref:zinc finger protein 384-like isoform X3 n=2 Tax=Oncorhynchus kisutch TaxID=8019 RepID=UPI0012DD956D|nr:zinc finger protein 384-like isoform X3 [Oncorhynchus kisutch]